MPLKKYRKHGELESHTSRSNGVRARAAVAANKHSVFIVAIFSAGVRVARDSIPENSREYEFRNKVRSERMFDSSEYWILDPVN